ncbi:MAG: ArnT family glycosyltransferase [Bdellovibrionales bacterium]
MSQIARVFWIALVIKLALSALLPLTSDEAYYWVWSRHMQLSYFDHPPFVAWLFGLGQWTSWLGGNVRWPGVLLGHAALGVWLKLLKPYLSERQRLYWLGLALLSPLVGGSALVVTPDLPLLFFYALSLWLFLLWKENPSWRLALGLGLSVGLGFSSKYMMVLFVLSLLPVCLLSPQLRRSFLRHLPLLFLGGLMGTVPVWLWNLLNDFASIKFQTQHGLGRSWKPSWTFHYIGLQVGLIFPVILYWALRARRSLPMVFHFLAWTPLVFFFFTTFRGYVEANWPIAAYPALFALAVSQYPGAAKGLRGTLVLWGSLIALLAVVIMIQPEWSKDLKFREFHEYDEVVRHSRDLSPLYARSYQMASKMYFELGRPVYKLKGMNRKDFYDYLQGSEPQAKVYYVAVKKEDKLPSTYAAQGHRVVESLPVDRDFVIWRVEAP